MKIYSILHLVKILVLLVSSTASFCILALSYTVNFHLIESTTTSNLVSISGIFLLLSLLLLLIKDLVHMGKALVKEFITLIVSALTSAYIILGSIIDISRFRPCKYLYIPPMFIVLEYQIETITIKSLSISIPLGVASIVFIYSLYELIRTYRTLRTKYPSEIIDGVHVENVHDVKG